MINYNNFTNIKNLRNNFQSNQPFKHLVFQDFLSEETYNNVSNEFNLDVEETVNYVHFSQNKYGLTKIDKMGNETKKLINFFLEIVLKKLFIN